MTKLVIAKTACGDHTRGSRRIFAGCPLPSLLPTPHGDPAMLRHIEIVALGLIFGFVLLPARAEAAAPVAVVCDKDASFAEKLAGKEVRRYVYLRTGKLLPIVDDLAVAGRGRLDRRRRQGPAGGASLVDRCQAQGGGRRTGGGAIRAQDASARRPARCC